MRIAFAVFLILHGIAHGVGFAVPWGLVEPEEGTAGTTILSGRVDLGAAGIKVWGVFWLVLGLAFVAAGLGVLGDRPWWVSTTVAVASASLVASLFSLPEARIGVVLNVLVLAVVHFGVERGWL